MMKAKKKSMIKILKEFIIVKEIMKRLRELKNQKVLKIKMRT